MDLAGFFRRFIQGYANIATLLNRLLRKDRQFIWTVVQESAFEVLETSLGTKTVLQMYNPMAQITEVQTDASSYGLAGILLQGESSNSLHLIHCVRKSTTKAEKRYHLNKLELYAIIWALSRLRPYLLGIQFIVQTDCQALTYLNLHKSIKPQVARWFEVLQDFDFENKYRPGTRMQHIDALSRNPTGSAHDFQSVEEEFNQYNRVCVALRKFVSYNKETQKRVSY